MWYVYLYNLLLAVACIYAAARGGQPERLAVFGWAVACIATFSLPMDRGETWFSVEWGELAIDTAVFAWFVGITAVANRFWPIWVSAVHLLTIAVHGVKGYDPTLLPYLYSLAIGKLGYVVLALMVAGVARHQGRLRLFGEDQDWSVGSKPA